MTTYNFATMTQAQADTFNATTDYILFSANGSSTATQATISIDSTSTTAAAAVYTVTFGGHVLTFGVAADGTATPSGVQLANASHSGAGAQHLIFDDGSSFYLGSNAGEPITAPAAGSGGAANVVYGFGGNDTITLDSHLATASAYIYGGLGGDTIGSANADGNYHVYGNAAGTPNLADIKDTITLGAGTNYVNGNAGDDAITVGVSGSTGANRLRGGAGDDTITIHGAGVNDVNGNTGRDIINATDATGNNVLHGGKEADTITGGAGHDQLFGDLGSDTLNVSGAAGHITVLTGGTDAGDVFNFSVAGAGNAALLDNSATATFDATTNPVYYQEITDFTNGQDVINLGTHNPASASAIGTSDISFTTVQDAETFANGQLNNGTTTLSALTVGGDTYLFYKSTGATDPSTGINGVAVIHLDGVAASTIGTSDFGNTIVG